ncbi:endoglin isoform X1, partial [Tachysurus ichikawai]
FSDCNLEGIYGTENDFISVDEITDECRTKFVTEKGTEVHIVNLRISPDHAGVRLMPDDQQHCGSRGGRRKTVRTFHLNGHKKSPTRQEIE